MIELNMTKKLIFLLILFVILVCYINAKINVNLTIRRELEKNLINDYGISISADIYRIYYRSDVTNTTTPNYESKLPINYEHYPETLIVIKPLNWQIYTNNGKNFFQITTTFNGPSHCNVDKQLPTIVLSTTIQSVTTSSAYDSLRTECLNINQLDLLRMFNNCDQHISVNLSKYFDYDEREFTSISCLNALISLNYL